MEEIRVHLYRILVEHFSKEELRTLCFHLGVDYDELPGEGVTDKARELITYLERRHSISQLIEVGKQLRPDISWQDAPEASKTFRPTIPSVFENTRRGCYAELGRLRIVLILVVPVLCAFLVAALPLLQLRHPAGKATPAVVVPATTHPPTTTPSAKFGIADSIVAEVGQKGTSKGDKLPFVVILEESHDSRAGQVEIAIMLNRLYHKYGLRHLALEGAVLERPAANAQWFHTLPDANVRRDVALQLLGQGETSAAEFAAMAFPDFELHPIEHEAEYQVEMSDEASIAFTYYLLTIAQTSLTSSQISEANLLIKQNKQLEAIEYIINSNSWTKQRYQLLNRRTPVVTIEEMQNLANELEAKAKSVEADVKDYDKYLQEAKNFFGAAGARSKTMVSTTFALSKEYSQAPIAMVIGAAHTNEMAHLTEQEALSFAVISPLALLSDQRNGDLYSAVYNRKLEQLSVDPVGVFGAFLDGRRKPRPVINEEWVQDKAKIMYAGIVIARAATGGGKPPFGLDKKSLGLLGPDGKLSPIDIDLAAIQIVEGTTSKDDNKIREVVFPVKLISQNKTLWMRVGQVDQSQQLQIGTSEEETLEQALMMVLTQIKNQDVIDSARELEGKYSASKPGIVSLSVDVKAVMSDTPDAILTITVSG